MKNFFFNISISYHLAAIKFVVDESNATYKLHINILLGNYVRNTISHQVYTKTKYFAIFLHKVHQVWNRKIWKSKKLVKLMSAWLESFFIKRLALEVEVLKISLFLFFLHNSGTDWSIKWRFGALSKSSLAKKDRIPFLPVVFWCSEYETAKVIAISEI